MPAPFATWGVDPVAYQTYGLGGPLGIGTGALRAAFRVQPRHLSFRASARTLSFRSTGGAAMMQPTIASPQPYALRPGEENQQVRADFTDTLAAGEQVLLGSVRIMGIPPGRSTAVDMTMALTGASSSPAPVPISDGSVLYATVSHPPPGWRFTFYFYATTDSSPARVIEDFTPPIIADSPV